MSQSISDLSGFYSESKQKLQVHFCLILPVNPNCPHSSLPHYTSNSVISIIFKYKFTVQILLYLLKLLLQAFFTTFYQKNLFIIIITILKMVPTISDAFRDYMTCSIIENRFKGNTQIQDCLSLSMQDEDDSFSFSCLKIKHYEKKLKP